MGMFRYNAVGQNVKWSGVQGRDDNFKHIRRIVAFEERELGIHLSPKAKMIIYWSWRTNKFIALARWYM